MERRQTFNFNQKINRIINNRNLKEYSCFIGVKTDATWTYTQFKALYTIKTSYVKSKTLFDYVYGCRMANGNKSTQDGSDYFGVGFIHLTGKEK